MIGWLWRVLVGRFSICEHKWKVVSQTVIYDRVDSDGWNVAENIRALRGDPVDPRQPVGRCIALQCEKCGDITTRRI